MINDGQDYQPAGYKKQGKIEELVRDYFYSSLEDKNSKFDDIVGKLDFENKKLKEYHIGQKNQHQVNLCFIEINRMLGVKK